ncbi:MAG TPA: DEAD/DEAH box helicase [Acetobacteraceae bacterium]|nr:DEAD/DEAH box helicase [Acetobacteraceae bacterium]
MAFRPIVRPSVTYPSPEALFNDRRRRKYAGLLSHQADVLRSYQSGALTLPDVAFQMPTGSGKTLVGVLVGEWRRVTYRERPLYLTPTRQLAFQVANEARDKYDIRVIPLVGSKSEFPPEHLASWEAGDAMVVTTYRALFNVRPAFEDPQIIVVDDAHAAENHFAAHWTLTIRKDNHPALWAALAALLKGRLSSIEHKRLLTKPTWPNDLAWVDKLPTPVLYQIHDAFAAILDEHLVPRSEEWYAWSVLRNNLLACHLYLSATEACLRPLLAPSGFHPPFSRATQRIYMSATLGQGGDLERLTGRRAIHRIPIPTTWETQGLGRRLFLFPSRSLNEREESEVVTELMMQVPRCVVLTPTTRRAEQMTGLIRGKLGYTVFNAEVIERTKAQFVSTARAAAVLANRYDGIDFPDDECRLLVIDGMARAVNLQERFLMSRMGAALLLNDRMLTRITQAFGRCTRSATDYSCVVVLGQEVMNLLVRREKRALLHPELQAEIEFGLDQSSLASKEDYCSYLGAFLAQDSEWYENGEVPIQGLRTNAKRVPIEGANELAAAAPYEISYQELIWRADYEGALDSARRVVTTLKGEKLAGYRALWNYLAGSAALLASEIDGRNFQDVAKDFFWAAARETHGITWLKQLSRYSTQPGLDIVGPATRDGPLLERMEAFIEDIGTASDNKLVRYEKDIREGLSQDKKGPFEKAHECLGRMLGYEAGNKETPGAPDPWWIVDSKLCFIFEDHSDAKTSSLDVNKARQVASHPKWVRANLELETDAAVVPVLVSPVSQADTDAIPHLEGVALWPLSEFRGWAEKAISAFREARKLYPGSPGDIAWQAEARAALSREGVDLASLLNYLKARDAKQSLSRQS